MSVNQSTESTTSSLQRSGLSITVGDTKSIVLALQALQSKIRSLEQDRDYHQDQYEVSLQAHERYKLDMERQLEQERAAHHTREAELLDLLRKAREERAELEAALNGNKEDLGGFRKELEEMIASEKKVALQRESKLNEEVAKLRDDIKEEQARRAALLVTVEKLKEEREAALRTNEQLRVAMDDLLTRFEQLQQQQAQRRTTSMEPVHRAVSRNGGRRGPSPTVYQQGARRGRGANVSARDQQRHHHHHSSARPRVVVSAQHHTYEDPTCSSMLRDVRVVPDEAPPCVYPSVNSSLQQQQQPGDKETLLAGDGHISYRREQDSARQGSRHASPGHGDVSARSTHQRTTPAAAAVRTPSPSSSLGARKSTSVVGTTAMNEVEKQLRSELAELQRQYEDTVTRGSAEEIPSEVLAAALHRVAALIEQKKEQVKLLKEARVELEDAVGGAGDVVVSRNSGNRSGAIGDDKATRRTMLVNELRSLLAEASS